VTTLSAPTKRRNPWIAALLSLFVSGLGQLYNGQPARAAVFLGVAVMFMVVFALSIPTTFGIFIALVVAMVAIVGWKIAALVDAFLQARRRGAIALAFYNRWYVYLAVVIALTVAPFALPMRPGEAYESFSMPGPSNAPNLVQGDVVMSIAVAPTDVQRGDMVIFRLPRDSGTTYIKRVIGMPGDRIELRKGQVFINDVPVERTQIEDYEDVTPGANTVVAAQYRESLPGGRSVKVLQVAGDSGVLSNMQPVTVPAGHYFVLGDNRDQSLDSRVPPEMQGVGMVPAAMIYRKPLYIYWAKDRSRIGLKVE
jgi:signal peptidase I